MEYFFQKPRNTVNVVLKTAGLLLDVNKAFHLVDHNVSIYEVETSNESESFGSAGSTQ